MGMERHMFLPKLLFAAGFKTVNNEIMKNKNIKQNPDIIAGCLRGVRLIYI